MFNVPHLGGNSGVVFFGPRSDPQCCRYWAERGLIHCEDARDNSYKSISVRTFLKRLKGVNDMLGNSKATLAKSGFAHYDEITRQQNFVDLAVDMCQKAKEQGMPEDPSAVRDLQNRRKKTIVMPGLKTML